MATKVERQLAEQVLLGKLERPAEELLRQGLESFVGVRRLLRPTIEELLTPRSRVVRCKLKRGARIELYLGHRRIEIPERSKTTDPDTGLTKVTTRVRVQIDERSIMRLVNRNGGAALYVNPLSASHVLAERCRGDADLVERVCAAIERARRRYFELAEVATRWR
jgi:hypothetical protein